jgi:hypothetical protein
MCRIFAVRDMQLRRSEGIGGMRQNGLSRIAWSALIGTAIVAAACASSLRVRTDYDRTANFKQYRTFAIRDGNSSGNPVMDQRIKDDIVSAFKTKGLDEVRPENADILIVPHTATRTQRTYDTFYDNTWRGWRWRIAEPTVVVNEFQVGTLVVDVFDNRAKTAVWHGYVSGVLEDEPSKNAEKADKAVQKLISEYPG